MITIGLGGGPGVGLPSWVGKIEWSGKEDERLLKIPQVVWLGLRDDSLHSAGVGTIFSLLGGERSRGKVGGMSRESTSIWTRTGYLDDLEGGKVVQLYAG